MRNTIYIFLILAFIFYGLSEAFIVDKLIAVVNDEVICQSDLDRYKILTSKKLLDTNTSIKGELDELLLSQLINRKLILQEIKRLGGLKVDENEIKEKLLGFSANSSQENLTNWLKISGLTERDLNDFIKDELLLEKFIQMKFRATIMVSEEEIDKFLISEKVDTLGNDPEVKKILRDNIRHIITEQKTNDKLELWLKEKRQKANIRILKESE